MEIMIHVQAKKQNLFNNGSRQLKNNAEIRKFPLLVPPPCKLRKKKEKKLKKNRWHRSFPHRILMSKW
jgi:hypothetical protein